MSLNINVTVYKMALFGTVKKFLSFYLTKTDGFWK